ncbi:MAG TPA: ATP-dependent Clp protease adaptor ClpS [Longimicrobiaceae bacterium]
MSHVHLPPVYHHPDARRDDRGDRPPSPPHDPGRGTETEREEGVAVAERPKTRRPTMYRVLLHNDDYTTMEFVVEILVRHFDKTPTEATRVMLQVHHLGVGVAGTYTRDEAETRIARVTGEAQGAGYPLLLTMEPE